MSSPSRLMSAVLAAAFILIVGVATSQRGDAPQHSPGVLIRSEENATPTATTDAALRDVLQRVSSQAVSLWQQLAQLWPIPRTQRLPSPWRHDEDVVYFVPGPEFKLAREAAAMKKYRCSQEPASTRE